MSRRKSVSQAVAASWIPESRSFFTNVVKDTIQNLRQNEMCDLSRTDQMALDKLEAQWLKNYKPSEHMPESNPCPLPAPKPARRRPPRRPTAKPQTAPAERFVDASTLEDSVAVVYRICIPPLRPHWQCRSFDLNVPAHVCKNNLIEPLVNWQLLDNIMELTQEEGTDKFQAYVNSKLHLN